MITIYGEISKQFYLEISKSKIIMDFFEELNSEYKSFLNSEKEKVKEEVNNYTDEINKLSDEILEIKKPLEEQGIFNDDESWHNEKYDDYKLKVKSFDITCLYYFFHLISKVELNSADIKSMKKYLEENQNSNVEVKLVSVVEDEYKKFLFNKKHLKKEKAFKSMKYFAWKVFDPDSFNYSLAKLEKDKVSKNLESGNMLKDKLEFLNSLSYFQIKTIVDLYEKVIIIEKKNK